MLLNGICLCSFLIFLSLLTPSLGHWSKALVKRQVFAAGAYVFKAVHYNLHRSDPEQFNVRFKGVHQLTRTVDKLDTPSIEMCGANPAIDTVPVTGGLMCDHRVKKEMTVKEFSYKTCNDSEAMIGFTEYYKTIPVVKRALCAPNEYEDYPLHCYPTLGMEEMDPEDPDAESLNGKKIFCKTQNSLT